MSSPGMNVVWQECASGVQGRRVLLAEDNLINQTVAKKMLDNLGMLCEVSGGRPLHPVHSS